MKNSSLPVGETLQLEHSWSSANDAVATVAESGFVTAVAPGTVEIYCTVEGLSVATIVKVVESPPPQIPNESAPETPDV